MAFVAGVRCSVPGKDAGSARINAIRARLRTQTWGASSAARRHSRYFAMPSYEGSAAGVFFSGSFLSPPESGLSDLSPSRDGLRPPRP